MKFKHALILLVIGYCFDYLGAFEKILHTQYADFILMAGMIGKVIGGLLVLYKILNNPKLKDFLNS